MDDIGFNGFFYKGKHEFINNTVMSNKIITFSGAPGEGGGVKIDGSSPGGFVWLFNNIIGDNKSCNEPFCEEDSYSNLSYYGNNNGPSALIANNNIQFASQSNNVYWNPDDSFDENPGFVDSSQQNFQLYDGSRMLGAGAKSIGTGDNLRTAPSKDLLGNRRPNPAGSNPDIGAYENELAISPYPDPVANLQGFPKTKSVDLVWSADTSKDFKKYYIYQSSSKSFSSFLDTLASTTDTLYTASNLINGLEYHFWVTALDTNGFEGPPSNIVSVIPLYNGPVWWVDPTITQSGFGGSAIGDGSFSDPLIILRMLYHQQDQAIH